MQPRLTSAVFLTALLFGGCGGDVNKDKAQEQIKSGIASQAKADVKYVKCPGGVKAEKGATFQCEALIPVNVTQIDENGNIRWQITSFSGPPSGTTGATGATGVTGAAGVTPPGGAIAGGTTGPTGGGAVADNPRFERYTNRSQGYSILHPILWKRIGSGRDVNFPFPNGTRFIHVIIQDGKGLPTVADVRKSLRPQPGVFRKAKKVTTDKVGGQPVIFAEYLVKLGNLKRQVIRRYVFARGDKRALIELGAHEKLANKKPLLKKFDRTIRSFRWLSAGT
jgi:uncharacterized protein DUF4333